MTDTNFCKDGKHDYEWSRSCGAYICYTCDIHSTTKNNIVSEEHPQGNYLARCYCGWSLSGGDGYAELIEEGETIEADY